MPTKLEEIGHYGYRKLELGMKATKTEISGIFVHYCVLIHSQMPSVLCSESVRGVTGGSSVCDRSCSGTVLQCVVRRVTTTWVILILTFPVFQWLYLAKSSFLIVIIIIIYFFQRFHCDVQLFSCTGELCTPDGGAREVLVEPQTD